MTKNEELKILEQIEELIGKAGTDSYIALTFKGVADVCRNNIRDDFGDSPVLDLEMMRNLRDAEVRRHDETKRMLEQANELWKQSMDEVDALRKQVKEVEDERDALSDSLSGMNDIAEKTDTIIRQSLMKAFARVCTDYGDARYGYSMAVREIAKALGFKHEEILNTERNVRAMAETNEELVFNMTRIELSVNKEEECEE